MKRTVRGKSWQEEKEEVDGRDEIHLRYNLSELSTELVELDKLTLMTFKLCDYCLLTPK